MLYTQSDYKGGSELFFTEWSEVSRGEVARFNITNKGSKPHKFKVFGKTTKAIKPGPRRPSSFLSSREARSPT